MKQFDLAERWGRSHIFDKEANDELWRHIVDALAEERHEIVAHGKGQ